MAPLDLLLATISLIEPTCWGLRGERRFDIMLVVFCYWLLNRLCGAFFIGR